MGKRSKHKSAQHANPAAGPSTRSARATAWKQHLPIVKFAATFLGLFTAFQLAYYALIMPSSAFKVYLAWNSRAAAAVLDLLGEKVTATNNVLSSSFSMIIKSGCDGLQAMAILAIAVSVFPGGGWKKLLGAAAGVALLAIVNLMRLVSLFWAGLHVPNLVQPLHVHIWPAALIVVALLYALAWTAWVNRRTVAA